jgi:Ubiquitin family
VQISVKSWEGIEIALEVVGGLTIACVNAMIEQKMEIRTDLQSLTFDGWRLEDTRTLSDYDIQEHSQLDLSLNLQLRGAMQT